jgi:serine/threonine protein kinase
MPILLEKGTIVADFRVEAVLGESDLSTVYRAKQLALNRTVALKILAHDLSDDPGFRERFRREGRLQAALDHPHIVPIYQAGEDDQGLFLAMRLVRGPTLKDMIISRELDVGRSLRLLGQVADALDAAHHVGLIHRDVKPQNVLVAARDHAYLADFGLTKDAAEDAPLTESGQFIGTIDYVAPEQIQAEKASARSDVYALAGVLFECLTGVVPYPRPQEPAVLYAHLLDPPPRVTDQRPELPTGLGDVIAKGMAKTPADRYASASRLIAAARDAMGDTVRAATMPPRPLRSPQETGVRPTRRRGA